MSSGSGRMKMRSLSATEKGMIIVVALLAVLVALRWGHIRRRAAEGMSYLKPADSTLTLPPAAEGCD